MLRGGFFACPVEMLNWESESEKQLYRYQKQNKKPILTQNDQVQCSPSTPKAHDSKKNYCKTESHIDIGEGVENKVSFISKNVDIQYITPVHRKTVIDQ
jgi:hypothetical protein